MFFSLVVRILAMASVLGIFAANVSLAGPKLKRITYKTADGTRISAYIMRPRHRGRRPAIIALHGCSGLKNSRQELLSRHRDWGERFVKWGYVVLFPDSYGSRNVGSLCRRITMPVTYEDRINDALAARLWLSRRHYVNSRRITLLGWSSGAGTALRLAYSKHGKRFRQTFAFYPNCKTLLPGDDLKLRMRLTILMGKRDDWTPPEPCEKLVWNSGGHIILYDKAHHGFDIPNAPLKTRLWVAYSKRDDGVVHVGTNKKAREQSIKDVYRLLRR